MPRTYTTAEIDAGLMALVEEGTIAGAERKTGIGRDALKRWRDDEYSERFKELTRAYAKEVEEELIHMARANARRAAEIEAELLERMLKVGDREAPQALRAATDAKSKNIDKVLSMTGRPTAITETRDVSAILERLARSGVVKRFVDGSAEEEAPSPPKALES